MLIGLQLHSVLATVDQPSRAVVSGLLVALAVVGTRLGWLHTVPYLLRVLDRRPAQRLRRVGARQRFPVAWAGFRGAVSLSAALAVPQAVPDRDTIVLTTFGVILVTLLAQGLTMPRVVRWAQLPSDPTERDEEQLANREAARAGLLALDTRAARLASPYDVVEQVRQRHQRLLDRLDAGRTEAVSFEEAEETLLAALLPDKRASVVRLRDRRHIDDTVLRRVQSRLDAEELRLTAPAPDD